MTLNFHYLIFEGNFLPSLKSPCVAGGHMDGSAINVLSIAARKVIMRQPRRNNLSFSLSLSDSEMGSTDKYFQVWSRRVVVD